jgi:hypothetical protein
MARKARQIDYVSLAASELVWLAQVDGDQSAIDQIYSRVMSVAQRIAANYCRRYTWISPEDLSQSLLLELPKIIGRYRPGQAGTSWEKYVYFRLTFAAKDQLRGEDPLGISYPQKKQYPEWHRLGDEAFSSYEIAGRKEPTHDEVEMLQLLDSIDGWRAAFIECRCVCRRIVRPLKPLDPLPAGWSDGRYYGEYRVSKRKRVERQIGLRSWIVSRKIPKQMELFV